MKIKLILRNNGKLIGFVSLLIPLIGLPLILNWFFQITPYQKLQGMPLLIAPFASLLGIILSLVSSRNSPNIYARLGLIINLILLVLPFLYWYIGAMIFGP